MNSCLKRAQTFLIRNECISWRIWYVLFIKNIDSLLLYFFVPVQMLKYGTLFTYTVMGRVRPLNSTNTPWSPVKIHLPLAGSYNLGIVRSTATSYTSADLGSVLIWGTGHNPADMTPMSKPPFQTRQDRTP